MASNQNHRGGTGQTNVWIALAIAILALLIAIVAWTRADPGVADDIDAQLSEVRQEVSQQVEALREEVDELRRQIEQEPDDNQNDE